MITDHHARNFTYELTRRRAADGTDRLSQSLFDAEDEFLGERNRLIGAPGRRLNHRTNIQKLFTIQWEVV